MTDEIHQKGDPSANSDFEIQVELGFICPKGCPNEGLLPSVFVSTPPANSSGGLKVVLVVFIFILTAWIFRIAAERKAPTPIEYGLSAVCLFSLMVAPVEAKDLSISVMKVALQKITGTPQTVSIVVSHVTGDTPTSDSSQKHGG